MIDILLTIPALVILLGTLVFFHELGHFTVAKLLKIRVEEFAFGFGPKWIRLFKRGETEYTIHPVPLGGFVKLVGGEPGEQDVEGGFMSKPWYVRWLVFAAGPFMSFVLAYLIFCSMGMILGLPAAVTNEIAHVQDGSIAEKVGLQEGDRIIRINDKPIKSGEQMVETVHESPGKPLDITILRDGQEKHIKATPEPKKVNNETIGLLGFRAAAEYERVGFVESMVFGTNVTTEFIVLTITAVFSRDVADNVGGPLAIFAATQASVQSGLHMFLKLMGALSLSLGVINLLPIPIIDGGQMLLLVIEGIKGRRLSQHTIEVAQRIGLAMIAFIFLAIMYLDLSKIVDGKFFN